MKILIWLVISNFGIWISSFAQTNEGGQRAEDIGNELERILSQDECLFFKNRLINILRTLGANIQLDANQMSMRFEEEMKKMVSMGELSRSCHRKILDELKERKLTAISPEAKPVTASAPAATALGPPGQAKAANETKEPNSPQTAKPETVPATLDKIPTTPKSPVTGKGADGIKKGVGNATGEIGKLTKPDTPDTQDTDPTTPKNPVTGKVVEEIKKGANVKVYDEPGKAADAIKEGANSNLFDRPETGHIPNVKRVTGTGNTTGHIATLTVSNTNDYTLTVMPQIFYIPSDGRNQSYVGRIPDGIVIPPGTTTDLEVMGNCANVNAPPVPNGDPMPPIDTWIPVVGKFQVPNIRTNTNTDTKPPVNIIRTPPVSLFKPNDIQNIMQSNGFNQDDTIKHNMIMTLPGTDIPVGGIFDPVKDPRTYAPVVVAAIVAIEDAVEVIQASEEFTTPISNNLTKERESIIQQTFWIFCAGITGKPYDKEDFKGKVYEQVEQSMGKTVASMPNDQKEEVDIGIDDFWNTFQATGVEAKILLP